MGFWGFGVFGTYHFIYRHSVYCSLLGRAKQNVNLEFFHPIVNGSKDMVILRVTYTDLPA